MERLNAFPTDLSFGAPVKFGGGGNTNGGAGGNALKHSSSGIAVTTTTTTNNTDADVGGVYSQQHCPMAQANFTYNILGGGVNDFNNTREILSSFDVDNDDMASNFGGDYYGNNSYGDGGGGTGNVPRGPKRRGRKPAAESEPPSKRIAQNRAAQKAYRQRKEGRLQELENKVRELEITTTLSTQASEFQRMVDENKALRSRLQQLEEENENLKQQVTNLRHSANNEPSLSRSSSIDDGFGGDGADTPTEGHGMLNHNAVDSTFNQLRLFQKATNLLENITFTGGGHSPHLAISPHFPSNNYSPPAAGGGGGSYQGGGGGGGISPVMNHGGQASYLPMLVSTMEANSAAAPPPSQASYLHHQQPNHHQGHLQHITAAAPLQRPITPVIGPSINTQVANGNFVHPVMKNNNDLVSNTTGSGGGVGSSRNGNYQHPSYSQMDEDLALALLLQDTDNELQEFMNGCGGGGGGGGGGSSSSSSSTGFKR